MRVNCMQPHKIMWDLCGIWDFAIKSQIDTLKKPYKISTYEHGEMAERLNALVLKTSKGATPSRVRIPVSPPLNKKYARI